MIRASLIGNDMPSYFTISKSYFINYTIPFYNTPNIQKFYFFPILFKYSILFFFYYFSFSIYFTLFLPQPLAPVSTHRATHTQTHDTLIHQSKPITTHTEPHTHTHKNIGNHSFETNFFIPEKPRQKRLRIKIHKFHFLSVLPQLSRKPNSSQRELW